MIKTELRTEVIRKSEWITRAPVYSDIRKRVISISLEVNECKPIWKYIKLTEPQYLNFSPDFIKKGKLKRICEGEIAHKITRWA